jgi:hypothetical protein
MLCHAACCDAAALASGRNWQIALDSLECRVAESLVVIGARIRYLGPKGPVEAPVRLGLADRQGGNIPQEPGLANPEARRSRNGSPPAGWPTCGRKTSPRSA